MAAAATHTPRPASPWQTYGNCQGVFFDLKLMQPLSLVGNGYGVKLKGIPLEFWSERCIAAIGNPLGRTILVDQAFKSSDIRSVAKYGHVVQDCVRPFRRYVWKKKEGSGACAETSNVYKPNDQQVEPVVLILDRASGDSGGEDKFTALLTYPVALACSTYAIALIAVMVLSAAAFTNAVGWGMEIRPRPLMMLFLPAKFSNWGSSRSCTDVSYRDRLGRVTKRAFWFLGAFFGNAHTLPPRPPKIPHILEVDIYHMTTRVGCLICPANNGCYRRTEGLISVSEETERLCDRTGAVDTSRHLVDGRKAQPYFHSLLFSSVVDSYVVVSMEGKRSCTSIQRVTRSEETKRVYLKGKRLNQQARERTGRDARRSESRDPRRGNDSGIGSAFAHAYSEAGSTFAFLVSGTDASAHTILASPAFISTGGGSWYLYRSAESTYQMIIATSPGGTAFTRSLNVSALAATPVARTVCKEPNLTESPTNHVKSVSRSTEIGTDTAQILRSGVVQNRILQSNCFARMDHDHIEVAELRVLIHWLCIRHMALEQSNSKLLPYAPATPSSGTLASVVIAAVASFALDSSTFLDVGSTGSTFISSVNCPHSNSPIQGKGMKEKISANEGDFVE
ncbi:hypothetical protein Acr_00g0002180 [Actinidia rufa]|uniref:Uncharacterized protein n=1 Tax=Actinidia rufa TaxID=165716 RepID=A0A7J0D6V8_9ERIC|nr:hypothetical protein Acr_00g0002180 [Actinidia rufa]